MKAHSLLVTSDGVAKTTADASEQVAWLGRAADLPLAAGIRPVRVLGTIPGGDVMEHVPGPVREGEPVAVRTGGDVSGILLAARDADCPTDRDVTLAALTVEIVDGQPGGTTP